MFLLIAIAATAAVSALVLTPPVARMATRLGVLDWPGPRKAHTDPVPRLGGVAILLSAALALVLFGGAVGPLRSDLETAPRAILFGALGIFLLGLWDDVRGTTPLQKLAFQVAIAATVALAGVRIERATVLGRTIEFDGLGLVLTVCWIVGLTNAFNLIDGLDGLATGVGLISGVTCGLILAVRGNQVEAALLAALVGAAAGFLPYNFAPARIFLGDCGSLLFGYLLATTAVTGFQKGATALSAGAPLLLFALPLVDTLTSIIRRSYRARGEGARGLLRILVADQAHIHHRLLAAGLSTRRVVLLLYTVTFGLCLLALLTVRYVP